MASAAAAAAPSPDDDYCSRLGLRVEDMPVGKGPLAWEEWLVLVTYVGAIALMLKGTYYCLLR